MSNEQSRILVIDDDAIVADSIAEFLGRAGYDAATTCTGEEAIEAIRRSRDGAATHPPRPFAVAIVDMSLPGDMDGIDVIRTLRDEESGVAPVAITGYGTIESAVDAIRLGAIDYLIKPIVDEELLVAVGKAINQHVLLAENHALREQIDGRCVLDNIIGRDSRMRRLYDVIEAVAPTRTTVLMTGESGTGKSLIARAIHRHSPRAEKPFVELSCGSIPETLLESELFGHVKGAFTGAHADKTGRFLKAHGGTIFLDEINSASPGMQLKLLRVLQERKFEPVGSTETIEVDARVVLASNQPLEDLVARGDFRQDLYYRINVVTVLLPPLRDRITDIPVLARHFLDRLARDIGKEVLGFTGEAMAALCAYAFPGNVRELENIIERAVVLTRSTRIDVDSIPQHVLDNSTVRLLPVHERERIRGRAAAGDAGYQPLPLVEALKEPEKQIILAALEANEWNRQRTADDLQINRTTLYKKMKQYGLEQYGQTG